uniref:Uncharacterized protein n=1 Tax=Dunaliella tertiolecta TaxID=3047 RepID=A0A7S3QYN2_DUNTE|eukprot:scaffold125799_cov18-Tisochrysis_lutea.AAC.1
MLRQQLCTCLLLGRGPVLRLVVTRLLLLLLLLQLKLSSYEAVSGVSTADHALETSGVACCQRAQASKGAVDSGSSGGDCNGDICKLLCPAWGKGLQGFIYPIIMEQG